MALYFRTLNLFDWDSGTGQHPDERFFTYVASTVRLPSDLGEFYGSSRSPLNPRSYEQFPLYVYGPLPIILTRAVAVMLTPPEALPAQVLSIEGPPRRGSIRQRRMKSALTTARLCPTPNIVGRVCSR